MKSIAPSRKPSRLINPLLIGVALSGPAWSASTITDLGTLGGYDSSAYGVNASGQVTGEASTQNSTNAFLYSNGKMNNLRNDSHGLSINNSGQVVGYFYPVGHTERAFLYSNGSMTDLGTLGGTRSWAYDINNNGNIVGYAGIAGDTAHAFLYSNGVMNDLGTLGGKESAATGINDSGQVVGGADTSNTWYAPNPHAFLYSNGVMSDLGTLGGPNSGADDINNNGQVVGFSTYNYTVNGPWHAFLYSNGSMNDLGTLGGTTSRATSINNNGQAVGWSYTSVGIAHAFLYSNGNMLDLNTLIDPDSGWVLNYANDINDLGQIVGEGTINGQSRAFLMNVSSVPVPATAWLFGSAVLGLTGVARRRKTA